MNRKLFISRIVLILLLIVAGIESTKASTDVTLYCRIPASTVGSKTVYANAKTGQGGSDWIKTQMKFVEVDDNDYIYKCQITATDEKLYVLQFQLYENGTWKAQQELTNLSLSDINGKIYDYSSTSKTWEAFVEGDGAYYLVSPQLYAGRPVKLSPTRYRSISTVLNESLKGQSCYKYQNVNIKFDDLRDASGNLLTAGTTVQWYIQKGKTCPTEYYQPETSSPSSTQKTYGIATYKTYKAVNSTTRTDNYFSFTIPADAAVTSYTFMWSKESDANYTVTLSTHGGFDAVSKEYNISNGYTLLGNFGNAYSNEVIDPTLGKVMTPYYYYGGVGYVNRKDNISPDSVIFHVTVQKPDAGWGNLYIFATHTEKISDYKTANDSKNTEGVAAFWAQVIRPEVQFGDNPSGIVGLEIDATSLNGGLVQANYSQSINPYMNEVLASLGVTSADEISSYDFSMNVTTGTYHLVFNVNAKSIELYDMKDVTYKGKKRNIIGVGDDCVYRCFVSFSDRVARCLPDNIDVYAVSDIGTDDEGKSILRLTKINDSEHNFIPANCGVILAAKDLTHDNVNGWSNVATTSSWSVEVVPAKTVTQYNKLVITVNQYMGSDADYIYAGPNYLVPQYDSGLIPKSYTDSKGGEGHNYLFGAFRRTLVDKTYQGENDDDTQEDFLFGYWLSAGTAPSNTNTSFLHVDADKCFAARIGTSYTCQTNSTTLAKPGCLLDFGGLEENVDVTTSIKDIAVPIPDSGYYSLSGIRITSPVKGGVYIHNDKKLILK